MRRSFILLVVLHLAMDLAMPSLPGTFRFNPDESVAGVRVQGPHVERAGQAGSLRESIDLTRTALRMPVQLTRNVNAPDLPVLLARRDPSRDLSRQSLSEDH